MIPGARVRARWREREREGRGKTDIARRGDTNRGFLRDSVFFAWWWCPRRRERFQDGACIVYTCIAAIARGGKAFCRLYVRV